MKSEKKSFIDSMSGADAVAPEAGERALSAGVRASREAGLKDTFRTPSGPGETYRGISPRCDGRSHAGRKG